MEDDLTYFQMEDDANQKQWEVKTMVVAPLRVT